MVLGEIVILEGILATSTSVNNECFSAILGILSSFKNYAPEIHHLSSGSSYVFWVMSVLVATFFFMTQLTRGVSLSEKLLPRLHMPSSLLRSKPVQHSHARSRAQVTLTV